MSHDSALLYHSPIAILLARIVPINYTDCMALLFHFTFNTLVLNSFHIEARIIISNSLQIVEPNCGTIGMGWKNVHN